MNLKKLIEDIKNYYSSAIDRLKLFWTKVFDRYEVFLIKAFKKYLKIFGWSRHLSRFLFRLVHGAVLTAGGLLIINISFLPFGGASTLGPFGDFFGGMLNPIFTFLMLIGLIVTIVLQKKELSLARKEFARTADSLQLQNQNLELQRFESTFFKLIEHFEHCRDDVESKDGTIHFQRRGEFPAPRNDKHGRDAIKKMYFKLSESFMEKYKEKKYGGEVVGEKVAKEFLTQEGINAAYNKFYEKNGEELGHYFRTLYHILNFIKNAEFLDDDSKQVYSKLFRAQLSKFELLLLFYNTISDYGWYKLKPLIQHFDILKHLEVNNLPEEHIVLYTKFNLDKLTDDGKLENPILESSTPSD